MTLSSVRATKPGCGKLHGAEMAGSPVGMPAAKPFSRSHLFGSVRPLRGQSRPAVRDSSWSSWSQGTCSRSRSKDRSRRGSNLCLVRLHSMALNRQTLWLLFSEVQKSTHSSIHLFHGYLLSTYTVLRHCPECWGGGGC